jgi:hypothetical protein
MPFEDSARLAPRIRRLLIEEVARQMSEEQQNQPGSINLEEIMRQQGLLGTAKIEPR